LKLGLAELRPSAAPFCYGILKDPDHIDEDGIAVIPMKILATAV
jgi:hypothetical protein